MFVCSSIFKLCNVTLLKTVASFVGLSPVWQPVMFTSNVTSVAEVRSASARLFAGRWDPLVSVITTLYYVLFFSSSTVVSRAFSVLGVYSKFGHHPHPLGYLYAKFRFFSRPPLLS